MYIIYNYILTEILQKMANYYISIDNATFELKMSFYYYRPFQQPTFLGVEDSEERTGR
jgi:hypothetical protein